VKKTQNRAITPFKVIQGHRGWYQSKARVRLLISELTFYPVPFRSYRSVLFKLWTLCVFEPPFGGGGDLGTTYDVHLGLIGKRVVDFRLLLLLLLPVVTVLLQQYSYNYYYYYYYYY